MSTSSRILIVDDEPDVLRLVSLNLKSAGFQVATAADGPSALAEARRDPPALMVLDIMMPGMSGIEVCRECKRQPATAGIAIVLLTAKAEEVDRIVGFELGADDYLVKPFSPRELVLRIKSILRRHSVPVPRGDRLEAGTIAIDMKSHAVTLAGAPIHLTSIQFKLLSALMERPGHVLRREDLLARVWPTGRDIGLRTIDTHLRRLRETLGNASEQIETVRGVGYRVTG